MPVPVDAIIAEFEARRPLLGEFAVELERLVGQMLRERAIPTSAVESRVKDTSQLREKLLRETASYERLYDVTDLVGVRVVTFFGDDVDRAASVIAPEFDVDLENSVDKRATLDPDRFGYLSVHYIVSLNRTRATQVEYQRFKGIPVEIQLRTLLQHAWAEIEHDLGYKSETAIPYDTRRRFSRLAGMLEIADDEFLGIRNQLASYETTVRKELDTTPEKVPVDQTSLAIFIETNALSREVDDAIAKSRHARLELIPSYLGTRAAGLQTLGIATLAAVEEAMQERRTLLPALADKWLRGEEYYALRRGIGLFFLVLTLWSELGAPADMAEALELKPSDGERAIELLRAISA